MVTSASTISAVKLFSLSPILSGDVIVLSFRLRVISLLMIMRSSSVSSMLLVSTFFSRVTVSPSFAPSKAAFSVAYVVSPICATGSDPSAIAVGTSVNIIVSDNNIARIRCFITFTS